MSKRLLPLILIVLVLAPLAAAQPPSVAADNPLLREWTTPFGVPPFNEIRSEHFLPAFKTAIAEQRAEVDAIVRRTEPPTLANTVEALELSGALLSKVGAVFNAYSSSDTNAAIQAINREVTPLRTALADDIRLNAGLFSRIKTVYDGRDRLTLTPVQRRLLEETYKGFVRAGANLPADRKDRLRQINGELAMLGVRFGDNLLNETNAYRLVIERQEDLAGLPPSVVAMGADTAKAAGLAGRWVYTLQAPSIWPFLQYSANRELRRQIQQAYVSRCDKGDQQDTRALVSQMASLRAERAGLLGYKTFADFVLEENMAKTPDRVYGLLMEIWEPALAVATREAADLQAAIKAEGGTFALEPWDWFYYSEKVKQARYDLDEQAVRQYFVLDNVRDGAFVVANKLYGLTITPRPDLSTYHAEVKAFEVKDADGSHLGVFYTDYHPRAGKRGGAWSSSFRGYHLRGGKPVTPVAYNVCNFSRPAGGQPALLSLEEVSTLFHEFGHALGTLLSKVPYRGLGGFPRDFVELPSQIMEHWALEPEVLRVYAKHYKTGEAIPPALVEKIRKAETFNQGFITVEYVAASILDMDWHTLPAGAAQDTTAFEQKTLGRIRMPKQIAPRYRSPYFNHIFGPGGGYASGYYAYIWSEVLDTDAFAAFKEKGNIFDPATARSFRTNILERGGTEEAAALWKRFRGKEPSVGPLLVRRGLK